MLCTTIETYIKEHLQTYSYKNTIYDRCDSMERIKDDLGFKTMITIEPIMEFSFWDFYSWLECASPDQINIGADSGNNNLPEPSKEKILELIAELENFTTVFQKDNLKRLLK